MPTVRASKRGTSRATHLLAQKWSSTTSIHLHQRPSDLVKMARGDQRSEQTDSPNPAAMRTVHCLHRLRVRFSRPT